MCMALYAVTIKKKKGKIMGLVYTFDFEIF